MIWKLICLVFAVIGLAGVVWMVVLLSSDFNMFALAGLIVFLLIFVLSGLDLIKKKRGTR